MACSLPLSEALARLPPDLRELVESLPPAEAEKVLAQLVVESEVEYRALEQQDLVAIQERTTSASEYGFKAEDVDLTWAELSRPNYLALGAFAQQEGREVPVAFIVAELCSGGGGGNSSRADEEESRGAEDREAQAAHSSSSSSSGRAPLRVGSEELRAAMRASGCRRASDVAVAVWYIGVSYEYRRQGLGSRLLDLVREVGEQAGAKSLWLHVASYNPNAIAFYSRYGLTDAPGVFKQGERGKHQLMHMPLAPLEPEGAAAGPSPAAAVPQAPVKGFAGGGGGGGGKKRGKGTKRRALPQHGAPNAQGGAGGAGAAARADVGAGLVCGGTAVRGRRYGCLAGLAGGVASMAARPRATAGCWRTGAQGRLLLPRTLSSLSAPRAAAAAPMRPV